MVTRRLPARRRRRHGALRSRRSTATSEATFRCPRPTPAGSRGRRGRTPSSSAATRRRARGRRLCRRARPGPRLAGTRPRAASPGRRTARALAAGFSATPHLVAVPPPPPRASRRPWTARTPASVPSPGRRTAQRGDGEHRAAGDGVLRCSTAAPAPDAAASPEVRRWSRTALGAGEATPSPSPTRAGSLRGRCTGRPRAVGRARSGSRSACWPGPSTTACSPGGRDQSCGSGGRAKADPVAEWSLQRLVDAAALIDDGPSGVGLVDLHRDVHPRHEVQPLQVVDQTLTGITWVTFWKVPDEFDCGNSENTPAAPPWISRTTPWNSSPGYASTVKSTRCPTVTGRCRFRPPVR